MCAVNYVLFTKVTTICNSLPETEIQVCLYSRADERQKNQSINIKNLKFENWIQDSIHFALQNFKKQTKIVWKFTIRST